MADIIYFVIPCYNEEKVLEITAKALGQKLEEMKCAQLAAEDSRILFVDDGSKDKTWKIIELLSQTNPIYTGVKLSKNEGQQPALFAGLMAAKAHADAVISMDADLQDDISVVEDFLKAYYDGNDIVYGVRESRKKDNFMKRFTAEKFYRFMKSLNGDTIYNHADYRLMSKKALEQLEQFSEVNLYLRGIVPLLGLSSTIVTYERQERVAGTSKYTLKKMFNLAMEGLTSFSVRPLRVLTATGCVALGLSVLLLICFIVSKIIGHAVFGISGLFCSIWLLGGMQLFFFGIMGEYLGKIFCEVKERPRYFIEKNLDEKKWGQLNVHPYEASANNVKMYPNKKAQL